MSLQELQEKLEKDETQEQEENNIKIKGICLKLFVFLICLTASTIYLCSGTSSTDNDVIGQVKKVEHITPRFFNNYQRVELSLGVMRNGVGSMSTQDIWLYVPNQKDIDILTQAAQSGALIKIKYDHYRFRWYVEEDEVTNVTAVQ